MIHFFSEKSLEFLIDLKNNNNREWFNEHKAVYKEHVELPAQQFAEQLSAKLADILHTEIGFKIYRIYRDVRFSKDKTPYNTHVHISFFANGDGNKDCDGLPSCYFALEIDKLITGVGCWSFDKNTLAAYRSAVLDENKGTELTQILQNFTENKGYHLHPASLKRVPSGFDKNHPRAELLKHKGLTLWHHELDFNPLLENHLAEAVARRFIYMKTIYDWIHNLKLV